MNYTTSKDASKKTEPAPLWAQLLSGAVGIYVMFSIVTCGNDKPAYAQTIGTSQSGALTICQMALKKASRDPSTAEVPYVGDQGGGREFYFAWNNSTKPVRMKNGFGAVMSGSASCTVDKQTGKITSLSLDGKSLM